MNGGLAGPYQGSVPGDEKGKDGPFHHCEECYYCRSGCFFVSIVPNGLTHRALSSYVLVRISALCVDCDVISSR